MGWNDEKMQMAARELLVSGARVMTVCKRLLRMSNKNDYDYDLENEVL